MSSGTITSIPVYRNFLAGQLGRRSNSETLHGPRVVYDFNDEIFGRPVAHSQVHARTSNAFILFSLAARDSFFNIYGKRTGRREKVERG